MPTATPDTLVETLAQFVTAAADEAAAPIERVLAQNPADVLQQLRDSLAQPDSFSLLVFVLVHLAELDPDHLSVGALAASDGWSRAVALTYRASDDADAPSATIALALTDPGTTHGVIFRVAGLVQATFGAGKVLGVDRRERHRRVADPVQRRRARPADRGVAALLPSRTVPCSRSTTTQRSGSGSARRASRVALSNEAPVWHVDAAMGDEQGAAGVEAHADLADALGPLSDVLQIQPVGERYSPSLSMGAGAAPAFTLGHTG